MACGVPQPAHVHVTYRSKVATASGYLPDFLIGAHAQNKGLPFADP